MPVRAGRFAGLRATPMRITAPAPCPTKALRRFPAARHDAASVRLKGTPGADLALARRRPTAQAVIGPGRVARTETTNA